MKIWIDRKGKVQSFGVGSIEEQQNELIAIMAYIQQRVNVSETIVSQVDRKVERNCKSSAAAIRKEYAEMGRAE